MAGLWLFVQLCDAQHDGLAIDFNRQHSPTGEHDHDVLQVATSAEANDFGDGRMG